MHSPHPQTDQPPLTHGSNARPTCAAAGPLAQQLELAHGAALYPWVREQDQRQGPAAYGPADAQPPACVCVRVGGHECVRTRTYVCGHRDQMSGAGSGAPLRRSRLHRQGRGVRHAELAMVYRAIPDSMGNL